jgi:hypothetical protein
MSGAYTFLPWARQGLGNRITASGPLRASVPLQLQVAVHQLDGTDMTVDAAERDVQLYGPGDIVGIDTRAVIRTEPRNGVTNFEPNFLAAVEFYDEDLPWRYTPAAPDAAGAGLRPWIALVVLKEEEEFDEGGDGKDRPLPYITVKNNAYLSAFPDPATLWAWAHVHVNRGLTASEAEIVATDRDAVASRFAAAMQEDADLAYSRVVCPRRLAADTRYHAFLIPAFESGRLAGLGLDPAPAPSATAPAWTGNGANKDEFPVYFRWEFRTGAVGDFEYLVRLLRPVPVDLSVGVRDLDVQQPGPAIAGISDPTRRGLLPLGGALRVPRSSLSADERAEAERAENWAQPYPHPFQQDLASLINLADSYGVQTAAQANAATGLVGIAGDGDPVVVPPLYGRWHAQTPRLLDRADGTPLPNAQNWVHELNLDPRHRVAAGLGTRVVQSKQEDLMAAAWQQVGAVLEANQLMRRFVFAQQISFVWHRVQLRPLAAGNPAKALTLTAPVHARVMAATGNAPLTMRAHVERSAVPPVLVSPAMRRLVRPGARLMRSLPFDGRIRPGNLLARVNSGEVTTAPPMIAPPGVAKVSDVAAAARPANVPGWLIRWLRPAVWRAYLPALIALILALLLCISGAFALAFAAAAGVVLAAGAALTASLLAVRRSIRRADALLEGNQTQASVDELPRSSDFAFTDAIPGTQRIALSRDGQDNPESTRFKTALKDVNALLEASVAADTVGENGSPRQRLDIAREAAIAVAAIDPALTLPRRAAAMVRLPGRIEQQQPETFAEAMAYPVFDIPMYRPLADLSAELLIPNVNRIENNSVTLLETNQKFVEAYMVGLNHEFARELLWREYPTDQRGSYFRQFWDVSGYFAGTGQDPEALRESLRDIPPLHLWSRSSRLGDHDARERPGDQEQEVVLVIRGELLKRYPGAVIYAQAADWARLPSGDVDRTKERSLVALAPAQQDNPPRNLLRTPLYMAKIEPDINFLGFDLTVAAARGGTGEHRDDSPGWFFVIKERPGEPRFGFDETSAPQIGVWNDLGWDRVPMTGEVIKPLPGVAPGIEIPATLPAGQAEKEPQRLEDHQVSWDGNVSAAELAYIMYQAPVMLAIHASELLPAV